MPRRFRIGTFNLFNLVKPNTFYYGKREYSQKNFKLKSDWIAEQLHRMNADIVGFQEIFHAEPLLDIFGRSQKYKHYELVTANANGKRPSVGLATRFPILKHEVIKEFPIQMNLIDEDDETTEIPLGIDAFSRPVIKAEVQVSPNLSVTVFVAHLKSKRPLYGQKSDRMSFTEKAMGEMRSLLKRSAEACALRTLLIQHVEESNSPAIVIGDLNDGSRSVSTNMIAGDRPWMRKPSDIPHDEWRKIKKKTWATLFHSCKDIQARQAYHDMHYTHIHNGHHECIDHIFVGNPFSSDNPHKVGRVINVQSFNDHLIDETLGDDGVPVWQSDHGQLTATIELDKEKDS